MRILCNLPLECFDDRKNLRGVELCTFGPADRMLVDGVHFPFDVAFDPSRQSIDQLLASLPNGFQPDLVLIWWPDQEPLPANFENCPVPTVGIVSDYNLSLPTTTRLQPFFDVLLCDRAGVDLFAQMGYPDVRHFCQYTWKRPFHDRSPDTVRDLDVAFAGNLNPAVQRERAPWIARLCNLESRGAKVAVHQGVKGSAYGDLLARARIGFNRSIRGEMNLRAFEVPACGALLMMERENLEVRDFFVDGEECVLYGEDDFEAIALELLRDEPRRARIAKAGHRRAQQHTLGNRMPALLSLLAQKGPGRARNGAAAAKLGRAEAMLTTWAHGDATLAAAMDAVRAAPDDARALNVLAVATLRWKGVAAARDAVSLLHRACSADAGFAPSAWNLAHVLHGSDRQDLYLKAAEEAQRRAMHARDCSQISGPLLPLGYSAQSIDWSRALQHAWRTAKPSATAHLLQPQRTELRPPSPALA